MTLAYPRYPERRRALVGPPLGLLRPELRIAVVALRCMTPYLWRRVSASGRAGLSRALDPTMLAGEDGGRVRNLVARFMTLREDVAGGMGGTRAVG
jgi:hypothetical protein